MDLEQRVEKLERESRWLKSRGVCVVAVLLTTVLVGGMLTTVAQELTDAAKQDATMRGMRYISTANWVFKEDTGRYAKNLAELVPDYLNEEPVNDGWGNALIYVAEAETYTLTSLGSDGAIGPAPPSEWSGAPYEPDLIMVDGLFKQAPVEQQTLH